MTDIRSPTPQEGAIDGKFHGGDPDIGLKPTQVTFDWLNELLTAVNSKADKGNTTMTNAQVLQALIAMTNVRAHPINHADRTQSLADGWVWLDGHTYDLTSWTQARRDALHEVVSWYDAQITDPNTSHNIYTSYLRNSSITMGDWNETYASVDSNRGGVGVYQGDAIRNITGLAHSSESGMSSATGAFALNNLQTWHGSSYSRGNGGIDFDTSRVVPTADRNRPQNHNIGKHWALYIGDI